MIKRNNKLNIRFIKMNNIIPLRDRLSTLRYLKIKYHKLYKIIRNYL